LWAGVSLTVIMPKLVISKEDRSRLGEMVFRERRTIKEAALLLGINYSSAKSVMVSIRKRRNRFGNQS
jgi:hypothetical protein